MASRQVVVSSGPVSGGGNPFLNVVIEMLHDNGVPARLMTLAEIEAEEIPCNPPAYDAWFVTVPIEHQERAMIVSAQAADRVKLCLRCESYIKPGLAICPKCGIAAPTFDPDEYRAAYRAWWDQVRKSVRCLCDSATSGLSEIEKQAIHDLLERDQPGVAYQKVRDLARLTDDVKAPELFRTLVEIQTSYHQLNPWQSEYEKWEKWRSENR